MLDNIIGQSLSYLGIVSLKSNYEWVHESKHFDTMSCKIHLPNIRAVNAVVPELLSREWESASA
jgi:hypothetical protein